MTVRDILWLHCVTTGLLFCSDTVRRQRFMFWLCTTSVGGEMDSTSEVFHFGVIAKAASARQYAQGELI